MLRDKPTGEDALSAASGMRGGGGTTAADKRWLKAQYERLNPA